MSRRPVRQPADEPLDEAPPPPPTHNQPPAPLKPEFVTELLQETCRELINRRDEILAGIEKAKALFPITSPDVRSRAGDFAGSKGAIAGFLKLADGRRVEEKQPYDQAAAAVQGFFRNLITAVEAGQKDIRSAMTSWDMKVEAERRAEAQRQAEIAAAAAREAEAKALQSMEPAALDKAVDAAQHAEQAASTAAAPAADLTRVHGQLGTVTGLHTRWQFLEEESDLMALAKAVVAGREPVAYLAFNATRIGYAVRSEKVRTIEGCTIKEVKESR